MVIKHDVIKAQTVQGLTCKIIAQKCRVTFDKGIQVLFLDQIGRDPLDLIRPETPL